MKEYRRANQDKIKEQKRTLETKKNIGKKKQNKDIINEKRRNKTKYDKVIKELSTYIKLII